MSDSLIFAGITRKSLPDRLREAATAAGRTFETSWDPALGGRLVYLVDGQDVPPREAAEMLGVPFQT